MDLLSIEIDFIITKVLAQNGNEAYQQQLWDFVENQMAKREDEWKSNAKKKAFDESKWFNSYFEAYNRLDKTLNYIDSYNVGSVPSIYFYQFSFEFEGRTYYRNTISEDDKFVQDVLIIKTAKLLWQLANQENDVLQNDAKLSWIGKPAQLGHIISELVNQGYIAAPRKKDNEINYNELARQVLAAFDIKAGSTVKSLSQSLNPNSENGQLTDDRKAKFNIPYIGLIN
ncbi:hypothetical protein [Chitinophaga polysaccharea]|uniref:hypothetical protein n=1 Tax=Chitinophaga polysaccharea TaxID=1293035 RepID=UPI00115A400F|nr:hypothetical protein [Chitinophaga polysaccharea]